MLLLEPSLRYALGGNFPFAVQIEGAAATKLIHNEATDPRFQGSLCRPNSAGQRLSLYLIVTTRML